MKERTPVRPRPRSTVAIGFVSGIVSGLPRHGIDAKEMLDHAEIASSLLDDPQARIPVARYAALYRLINERLDDEAFGLFSRPLRRGSFEFLCRGALSAATLDEAFGRIARFLHLVLDDMAVDMRRARDSALLVIEQRRPLPVEEAGRVFAFEWLLRLLHGLAAWLTARPLAFDDVAFPYAPPPHAAEYELVFAPRCSFGAPRLTARFAASELALPVRRDEAALTAFLADAPAGITTLYRGDRALAPRVRDALRAALPRQLQLPELAHALALSPRTLHRRLAEEQTSFGAVKEALRRELAIEWLTKSERPLGRIAEDLGFSDASVFYRAFAGWTGVGPRAYRRRFRD